MSDQPWTTSHSPGFGNTVGTYVSRRALRDAGIAIEAETLTLAAMEDLPEGFFSDLLTQAVSATRFGAFQREHPGLPNSFTEALDRSQIELAPRALAPVYVYEALVGGASGESSVPSIELMEIAFDAPWVITESSPPEGKSLARLGTEAVVIVKLGESQDPVVILVGVFGLVALRILHEPAGAAGSRIARWIRGDRP